MSPPQTPLREPSIRWRSVDASRKFSQKVRQCLSTQQIGVRAEPIPLVSLLVLPNGVPVVSVAISMAFGSLAYLSVSNGPAQVFSWLQNINAVSGLINWGIICLCWIRFNRARELQGIPRSSLPYKGRFLPYIGWYGLIASCEFLSLSRRCVAYDSPLCAESPSRQGLSP